MAPATLGARDDIREAINTRSSGVQEWRHRTWRNMTSVPARDEDLQHSQVGQEADSQQRRQRVSQHGTDGDDEDSKIAPFELVDEIAGIGMPESNLELLSRVARHEEARGRSEASRPDPSRPVKLRGGKGHREANG